MLNGRGGGHSDQTYVKQRPIGTPDRRANGCPPALMFAVARRRNAEPLAERSAYPSNPIAAFEAAPAPTAIFPKFGNPLDRKVAGSSRRSKGLTGCPLSK
jgi:hypothetical protein